MTGGGDSIEQCTLLGKLGGEGRQRGIGIITAGSGIGEVGVDR